MIHPSPKHKGYGVGLLTEQPVKLLRRAFVKSEVTSELTRLDFCRDVSWNVPTDS
ncbi:MAG: hypothetical protein ACRC11_13585 [Xenococcaceae cyanobacterium]